MNNSFTGINISGTVSPRNDNKQAVPEHAGVSCSSLSYWLSQVHRAARSHASPGRNPECTQPCVTPFLLCNASVPVSTLQRTLTSSNISSGCRFEAPCLSPSGDSFASSLSEHCRTAWEPWVWSWVTLAVAELWEQTKHVNSHLCSY